MIYPVVRLRHLLADDRRRGLAFQPAWDQRVVEVIAAALVCEQNDWRAALAQTRDAWQVAYDRTSAYRRAYPFDRELIAA